MNYKEFLEFMNSNGVTDAFLRPLGSLDEEANRFFEEMPKEYVGMTIFFIISTLREIAKYEITVLIKEYGMESVFYVIGAHRLETIPDCPAKEYIKNHFEIFNKVDTSADNDKSDKIREAKKVYEYFHEFYIRNSDFDHFTAARILALAEGNDEFHRLFDLVNTYNFSIPFFYNIYNTPKENQESLSDFHENMKATINYLHFISKNSKFIGPFIGCTDALSKGRDSQKIFEKWDRLLFVHDELVGEENPSKEQLLELGIKVIDLFGLSENHENKKITNQTLTDYQEAQTLILRAGALTFPY